MNEIIENPTPFVAPEGGMYLTAMAVYDLDRTARWAKFLSIVGFVMTGIIAIAAFFVGAAFTRIPQAALLPAAIGACITIFYLVLAAILFVLHLFLYQFASRTITAIAIRDAETLETGIHRLQSYFKAIGIIMIIELALIALVIIAGGLMGSLLHH